MRQMLPELDTYDWEEAFKYAEKPTLIEHGSTPTINPTLPLSREDVVEIRHIAEGENDGPNWIIVGRLKNGLWFHLSAGCDYTGWDCRAGGETETAISYEEIMRWACTDEDRARFAVVA